MKDFTEELKTLYPQLFNNPRTHSKVLSIISALKELTNHYPELEGNPEEGFSLEYRDTLNEFVISLKNDRLVYSGVLDLGCVSGILVIIPSVDLVTQLDSIKDYLLWVS